MCDWFKGQELGMETNDLNKKKLVNEKTENCYKYSSSFVILTLSIFTLVNNYLTMSNDYTSRAVNIDRLV